MRTSRMTRMIRGTPVKRHALGRVASGRESGGASKGVARLEGTAVGPAHTRRRGFRPTTRLCELRSHPACKPCRPSAAATRSPPPPPMSACHPPH